MNDGTELLTGKTADLLDKLLLTRADVSELLGVKETTVGNLHTAGRLVGHQIGKELRWRPADVRQFVDSLDER